MEGNVGHPAIYPTAIPLFVESSGSKPTTLTVSKPQRIETGVFGISGMGAVGANLVSRPPSPTSPLIARPNLSPVTPEWNPSDHGFQVQYRYTQKKTEISRLYMLAARTRPDEGRGPTAIEGRRPPGPGAGAVRGPAADRPGTGEPGSRSRTRGQARRGAGRGGVASRPIRRRGGDGTRAGRGRRRNGGANAGAEVETLLSPFSPLQ